MRALILAIAAKHVLKWVAPKHNTSLMFVGVLGEMQIMTALRVMWIASKQL